MTDTIQKIADEMCDSHKLGRTYMGVAPLHVEQWAERLRALSARASAGEGGVLDIEALRSMWRALVDAGGATTIARHGVERGSVEWANTVTYGMLAIERHLHPERFDDFTAAPQPAQAGDSGGGGPVGEFQDWFEAWAKEKEEIILHRIADGRLISPTASIAESAFLAGCMTASMYYMELCRNDSTAATQPSEAHTCDFMDGLDDCVACKATPPAHGDGECAWQRIETAESEFLTNLADKGGLAPIVAGMLRHCARLLTTRPTPEAQEARDAARWRALIGSARIRVLGSAGLLTDTRPDGGPWNGYAHIGLELWTKHEAGNEPTDAVEWLTKYTDTALALPAQGEGKA